MLRKLIFCLVLISLFLAGCATADEAPAGSNEIPELTETRAVEKVAVAQEAFFSIMGGGSDVVYEPFEYEGQPYFYMGESLDSWDKLRSYLGEIYTDEAIDLYIEYSSIIEHEGRLAHPDAAVGSLVNWADAEVLSVEEDNGRKTFELKVSYDVYTETVPFTFILENGTWKLSDPLFY